MRVAGMCFSELGSAPLSCWDGNLVDRKQKVWLSATLELGSGTYRPLRTISQSIEVSDRRINIDSVPRSPKCHFAKNMFSSGLAPVIIPLQQLTLYYSDAGREGKGVGGF